MGRLSLPFDSLQLDRPYRLRAEGFLKVEKPGKHVFALHSNKTDSKLFINGAEELRNHRWGYHRTSDIFLAEGVYAIAIECPEVQPREGGTTRVSLQWQRPGTEKLQEIEPGAVSHAAH
jgi:hypothetical protein